MFYFFCDMSFKHKIKGTYCQLLGNRLLKCYHCKILKYFKNESRNYFALIVKKSYDKTFIDFNFGRHKDLSTLKNYIHLGLAASVNIIFVG